LPAATTEKRSDRSSEVPFSASARSTSAPASTAAIPARTMARRSCRRFASERVSVTAWDQTRPKARLRRRIFWGV